MKQERLIGLMGFAVAVLMIPSASAANSLWSHKSNFLTTGLDIPSAMKLANGAVLQPGHYKLQVPKDNSSPQVVFYKDGKEVTRTSARVVSESERNIDTEIMSTKQGGGQLITGISPSGWREKLVFSKPGPAQGGN